MARGKQTKVLRQDQIERLEKFRIAPHDGARGGYSFAQLRNAMSLPFSAETLRKALQGRPIWDLAHHKIAEFIERHLTPVIHDGKTAAAGGLKDEQEETSPARTIRGSR